ncbi:unnamed protein product [Plutella xylostella]|uniref:(diamondback moth) hypothetical protein n=1 Tax=Plutella xylostella TaxID=51655 RepID=A0A8S4F1I3_PLUXY|nr:uncharacterized protein LOC105384356 isoform X1 [Plutella xylostella]CAG9121627.1 unnamed protein product [Plutella xylostella]
MGCLNSKRNEECTGVITEKPPYYDMTPILHRTVVFLNGVKGNGNSVVANTIAKVTGYTKIRPDDLLLDESVKETPRGMFIAEKMSKGEEIPEQTILDLIKEAMLMNRDSSGYILVDFPETDTMQDLFMDQVKPPDKMVKVDLDSTMQTMLYINLRQDGPGWGVSKHRYHMLKQPGQKSNRIIKLPPQPTSLHKQLSLISKPNEPNLPLPVGSRLTLKDSRCFYIDYNQRVSGKDGESTEKPFKSLLCEAPSMLRRKSTISMMDIQAEARKRISSYKPASELRRETHEAFGRSRHIRRQKAELEFRLECNPPKVFVA